MKKHLVIMAGGTGGHVFPALAVAKVWQAQGHSVSWLGTVKGIEARLVPEAGINLHYLTIEGVRGKGLFGLFKAPFKISAALWQSMRVLRQEKAQCVLGFGGFVAGPGGVAAKLLGIPLVIHEQNARAGTTNRLLARFAARVLQAFPNSFAANVPAITVGNPVRANLKPNAKAHDNLHILILGGSLGAKALNEQLPLAINQLKQVAVWHQTGRQQEQMVKALYSADKPVTVQAFIEDMQAAYDWADVVVCRAGAMTVSEVAAVGLPALLIPYPYAIDDHQTANAQVLVKQQAAFLVQQNDMTQERLLAYLSQWQSQPELRQAMADKAVQCAVYDAAEQVVQQCLEVAGG